MASSTASPRAAQSRKLPRCAGTYRSNNNGHTDAQRPHSPLRRGRPSVDSQPRHHVRAQAAERYLATRRSTPSAQENTQTSPCIGIVATPPLPPQ